MADLRKADAEAQVIAERAASTTREWMENNAAAGGVCDFCCHLVPSEQQITYVVGGTITSELNTLNTETLGTGVLFFEQDPYWLACPACDRVIQEKPGDVAALVEHVAATYDEERVGPISDPEGMRESLTQTYTSFYALTRERMT